MRTYEITRGNDLTRTLHVHTDGRVIEEIPGHDFPEGYLPSSKQIGTIERRIKPGTRTSRQYRAIDEHRRPGLWHRELRRAVDDVEYFTRKQYLAETRCELVDRYIAVQQSELNGQTYYVARTTDGRMIGPMTGGIEFARAIVRGEIERGAELAVPTPEPEQPVEVTVTVTPQALATVDDAVEFLAACKLASRQRKLQVDTFRFNGRVYIIETTGPYLAEVDRADDVFDQYTTTIDLRTIEVAAELDDDEPQLGRDVDTGEIVALNVDEIERQQIARQHLDERFDC